MKLVTFWVGDWGTYFIPVELQDVPITQTGWPDMRFKRALDLLEWVAQEEYKAKKETA